MIIKKDSEIVKAKVKRKSLALKAKKEPSDEECLTFDSEDEEYAMVVRYFKKFFKRRENAFRCDDLNHLIGDCPKPPKDNNQRAFVKGSWSDGGEEDDGKVKNKMCLVAQASSESKDLTSLSLDELIGNLKVHEMIIKKDCEIVKAKVERKLHALKAKKESSDEECSTSGSEE
nr:alpha/beta hydrolases superfamily protein [Tanacetum cinerariifolium]